MRVRFVFVLILSFLFNSCSSELEQPTTLLTQVITFYDGLEKAQASAFAASADGIVNTSYIYILPVEGATNYQYFQTSSFQKVSTNLDNYNERKLEMEDVFGGRLKRFVRNERQDVSCIITFQANGVFYQSLPIEIKNQRFQTSYTNFVNLDQSQNLMPKFSWPEQPFNLFYLQAVTDTDSNLLSGTITNTNEFQYGSSENVIQTINSDVPPALVTGENYGFSMLAIDTDFWANYVIQSAFIAR